MGRAASRMTIGLLLVLAVGLMVAPALGRAYGQTRSSTLARAAQLPSAPTITFKVTTTVPRTTLPPTPPTSSSASTTPITKGVTGSTRPRGVAASTSTTAGPSTTTTSTTLPPIPVPAPAPVTLPLASTAQSGNISAFFPIMSGFGFVVLIALLTAQWLMTKPGRKGPTL